MIETLNVISGGAKVTVRRASVLDDLNMRRILVKIIQRIEGDTQLENVAYEWVLAVTRSSALEGVNYTLPQATETADILVASMYAYMGAITSEFARAWQSGIEQVNKPLNDAKFTPTLEWDNSTDPNSTTPVTTIGQTSEQT